MFNYLNLEWLFYLLNFGVSIIIQKIFIEMKIKYNFF